MYRITEGLQLRLALGGRGVHFYVNPRYAQPLLGVVPDLKSGNKNKFAPAFGIGGTCLGASRHDTGTHSHTGVYDSQFRASRRQKARI